MIPEGGALAAPRVLPRPRLHSLDLVRFAAAISVVLFHFTARDHVRWGQLPSGTFPLLSEFTRYGYLGVHLFFVISGFVILMSAWGRSTTTFVASRVGRLYPAYWAAVLLTGSLRAMWPTFETRRPHDVLMNLTMLQEPFDVPHVDGVYWTLWVELQFYVLIALVVRTRLTLRQVTWFAAVVPVASTVLLLIAPGADRMLTVLGWLPLFGAGMLLFVIVYEGGTTLRWGLLALDAALASLIAVHRHAAAIDVIATGATTSRPGIAIGVLLVITLVALAVLVPGQPRHGMRVMTLAGALTYPLYLTHEYVGWAFIEVVHQAVGRGGALLLVIAVATCLAWLLHVTVERRWGRPLRGAVECGLGALCRRVRPMLTGDGRNAASKWQPDPDANE